MYDYAGLMTLESGLDEGVSQSVKDGFAQFPKFYVRKDKENHAIFISPDKKTCFCKTSYVVDTYKADGYLRLSTVNGHRYHLWATEQVPEDEEVKPAELTVLSKQVTSKGINYGNGFNKTAFKFNRPCTKEEFVEFLKRNNYNLHETDNWWDNYSELSGSGSDWTYTWVRVYTD